MACVACLISFPSVLTIKCKNLMGAMIIVKKKARTAKKATKEKLEPITLTQEEFVKKVFDYNDTTMIYKGARCGYFLQSVRLLRT